MFLTTEIAQILPGGLFWLTLQSEKKTFWGQKKKGHSLFSGPNYIIFVKISSSFKIAETNMRENDHLKRKIQDLKEELEFLKNENKIFVGLNEEIESLKLENTSLKTQLEDSSRLTDLSGSAIEDNF